MNNKDIKCSEHKQSYSKMFNKESNKEEGFGQYPCDINGVNKEDGWIRPDSDSESSEDSCELNDTNKKYCWIQPASESESSEDSCELNDTNKEDGWIRPASESESFKELYELNGTSKEESWFRPASESELFMELCHQNGFMLTAYQLTLSSREPIYEDSVMQALTHLYRVVPSLHMALRQREEVLWWHHMDQEIIDFKVVDKSSAPHEFESLKVYQYNVSRGPLWCARLSNISDEEQAIEEKDNSQFANHYRLLFGFHHAISDGPSSVKICRFFIDILNSVIQGHVLDNYEQLAEFVGNDQTKKLVEMKLSQNITSKYISTSNSLSEKIEAYIRNKRVIPLLVNSFPVKEVVTPRTLTITRQLDRVTTSKLKSKCKSKGVTVHTGFVSIANAAIVQLLQESGMDQESYDINAYHTINMRRYWQRDVSRAFGNHLGVLNIRTETPTNVLDNIWEYAQSLHKEFYHLLNDGAPLEELLLRRLCFMKLGINPSQMLKPGANGPRPHSYYGTTNLGDIDQVLLSPQKHVQVIDLQRSTSIHALGNTMTHVLHTFRGRLTYALDYVNTYMDAPTANRYMDIITHIITKNV